MEIKPNNIYCGDSYELVKNIPDKSIDLVYIDIPYLIGKGGGDGGGGGELAYRIHKEQAELGNKASYKALEKKRDELRAIMDNAKTRDEYEKAHTWHNIILNKLNLMSANIADGIDYKIFDELIRVMKYIYIYIWCSKDQIYDIMKIFMERKEKINMNILVWCKTNCVPATNGSWLPNLEYCLVFKQEGSPRYNDGIEHKSKWFISPTNKADKDLYDHPTIKDLQMVKNHIKHSTNKGDVVLDCYMGSGTTCVACKELERQYIGIEINPKYYEIAKDRLNGVTQKEKKANAVQMKLF